MGNLVSPGQQFNTPLMDENSSIDQLSSLSTSVATGPDKIPARCLKCSASIIAGLLLKIFSSSILTKSFPEVWKLARIYAVYKDGDRLVFTNYRPISIPCILSKLLERKVVRRVFCWGVI